MDIHFPNTLLGLPPLTLSTPSSLNIFHVIVNLYPLPKFNQCERSSRSLRTENLPFRMRKFSWVDPKVSCLWTKNIKPNIMWELNSYIMLAQGIIYPKNPPKQIKYCYILFPSLASSLQQIIANLSRIKCRLPHK